METVSLASAFAPHIVAVVGVAFAIMADAFGRRAVAVFGASAGLAGGAVVAGIAHGRPAAISGDLAVSGAGFSVVSAVVLGLAAVVVIGSLGWLRSTPSGGGLAALAAVVAIAAAAIAQGADLLVLLISLEAMAVGGYALVWSARTEASTEAALKFFVQGAVATSLFVLGLAILFGMYGASTSYVWLRAGMAGMTAPPVTTAFVLIAVALAYKLGAFPFHSWAPDAFESAPPHASALLAGIPKLAVVVALMFLFTRAVFPHIDPTIALWVFGALAVASMAFGVFGGLAQRSYTRMLAYSGIAQVGYALVAPALGAPAMMAVAVLLIAYAAAAAVAYLIAGYVRSVRPEWDGTIAGLAGVGRSHPLAGAALVVAMFSLVGMPLTAGFWGKFLVFGMAVSAGFWWLALVGVLASVVSFGYYGAVLKAAYFEGADPGGQGAADSPAPETTPDVPAVTAACVLTLVLLGIGVAPLFIGLRWVATLLSFA